MVNPIGYGLYDVYYLDEKLDIDGLPTHNPAEAMAGIMRFLEEQCPDMKITPMILNDIRLVEYHVFSDEHVKILARAFRSASNLKMLTDNHSHYLARGELIYGDLGGPLHSREFATKKALWRIFSLPSERLSALELNELFVDLLQELDHTEQFLTTNDLVASL